MNEDTYWKIAWGNKPMSKNLAKRVHKSRCIDENSWRGVADDITGTTDNQILGMKLCQIARNIIPNGKWN